LRDDPNNGCEGDYFDPGNLSYYSGAPAARRAAKQSPILMVIMASGTTRLVSWARTHDDDGGGGGGVAQHGGHTPKNRLIETYSLGLLCTSLILA